MIANPSLEWQRLRDVYYNLRTCFSSLNWPIESLYANYRIAVSPSASLLALTSKYTATPSVIEIYSLSGNKIWNFVYNSQKDDYIYDYHFRGEDLCVVFTSQKFRYYKGFKGDFNENSYTKDLIILKEIGAQLTSLLLSEQNLPDSNGEGTLNLDFEESLRLVSSRVVDKYLVLQTPDKLIITDLDTFKNFVVPISDLDQNKIHAIDIQSLVRRKLNLLVSYDKTVLQIEINLLTRTFSLHDMELADGPFTQIAVSANSQFVSLFSSTMKTIFVTSKDFSSMLLGYDISEESSEPYQISWCGNDAIVLSLRDEVKLIGPGQESISFFYDLINDDEEDNNMNGFDVDNFLRTSSQQHVPYEIPILKSHSDGITVITSNKVEFINRVSNERIELYQIGSSKPSSILLDFVDKLATNASKAEANISYLKSENLLITAINDCLEALLDEFDQALQKIILRAVSFGKAYCEKYNDSEKYLLYLNYTKVMNQLRFADVGLFVTYDQMMEIGWENLIQMLLRRSLFLLAIQIIDLLELPNLKDLVYTQWCCQKIKKEPNISDMNLFKIIAKKLVSAVPNSKRNYVSVETISDIAFEEGRTNLCNLLINLESNLDRRIKQLLKHNEIEMALIKSFQAGNYEMCKLILIALEDNMTTTQFFKILDQNQSNGGGLVDMAMDEVKKLSIECGNENLIINGDLIGNFWVENIAKHNSNLLSTYWKQQDKKYELSLHRTINYLETVSERDETYYEAYKLRLSKLISRSPNKTFTKIYQKERDILELQKKLGETYQMSFYDEKSLYDIVGKLVSMNQVKRASKVSKDLGVSIEDFWYLVVEIFSSKGEWDKLYKFIVGNSNNTSDIVNIKSPIGFKDILKTYFDKSGPKEHISVFIKNSTNLKPIERVELFIQNKEFETAAQEAFKIKDIEHLRLLYEVSESDQTLHSMVKTYITKLGY
ncbi:uncharacterized protein KQ657_001207 [Scheffersomyces spartinae]|uniref:Probable vacuolar protein sorting-associated protein 16 homolog n=1 Tax=Scheffersomyces spartinae TaxID=45513 RepID=A0A9P7V814_9ASCO|nr:uncharacterized protein KQ657_001207 [Scheffersomyces spartinae]KAG7193090.1 hypothetical protein KQ657_001207 [Scheffersomyces spartinae]